MDQHRAKKLLERYRQGQCSDAERRQVKSWYLRAVDGLDDAELGEPDYAMIEQKLRSKLPLVGDGKVKRISSVIPYAAAVLIAATVVTWMFFLEDTRHQAPANRLAAADISPGGNRATLTLANGRTISLDEAQKGIIVGAEGITYANGNAPVAILTDNEGSRVPETLVLTTPKGGTYQVTLPDGSKVWLNAASTIKYPNRFVGNERIVEISGEAYFSVATDKSRPFKVASNGQTVEVLGTEFNISAYSDDAETKTTLVEGKVKVTAGTQAGTSSLRSSEFTLKPGQQATTHSTAITINEVDTERYTAWKSGYFYFKNTPFEEVMHQLVRWYDVEVLYNGKIPQETFSGKMGRDLTLNAVLKLLNVSEIQAQIAGDGKLIVY